jgi:hypothetical protein
VKRAEWKLLAKSERAPLAIEEGVERADWSRDEDCDLKEEQSLLWIKGGVPLLAEEVDLREPLRVLMLWGAIPPAGVVVLLLILTRVMWLHSSGYPQRKCLWWTAFFSCPLVTLLKPLICNWR